MRLFGPLHPPDSDLAQLAGGEARGLSRRFLENHVRDCSECQERVAEFENLRAKVAHDPVWELPENLNWNGLAAEMRANIRLGLEAGECVRESRQHQWQQVFRSRVAIGFVSVAVLAFVAFVGMAVFIRNTPGFMEAFASRAPRAVTAASGPVLESTRSGIQLRTVSNTLMLLNRPGSAARQTVSARGEIGSRYVDGETGTVTIYNVYLP